MMPLLNLGDHIEVLHAPFQLGIYPIMAIFEDNNNTICYVVRLLQNKQNRERFYQWRGLRLLYGKDKSYYCDPCLNDSDIVQYYYENQLNGDTKEMQFVRLVKGYSLSVIINKMRREIDENSN